MPLKIASWYVIQSIWKTNNVLVTSAISVTLAGFYSFTTVCCYVLRKLGFDKILAGRSVSVMTAGTDLEEERSESGPDFQNGLSLKQSWIKCPSSVWGWRFMLFLLVLFLCGSITLFSLLHANPGPVASLRLPTTHPDEQITATRAGHSSGRRLHSPSYCIKAQCSWLCFEIVYSYFIFQVPCLLKRDVLWFQARWLLPGWVAEPSKISNLIFPVVI